MERKHHWAWPGFTSGRVPASKLHLHLEQEYATYVRDFPVLVGWVYVRCPVASARRELIENIYEEETGSLVAGRPHPELFLEVPRGLGMDLARFGDVKLLPAARRYRDFLDDVTQRGSWQAAAAVMTLFVEGTRFERGEIEPGASRRPEPPLEAHPLVVHYGLAVERLALTRAHRTVEGSHRASAWHLVLEHVESAQRPDVIAVMQRALEAWLAYRDDVAAAVGLVRGPNGEPELRATDD